MPSKKFYRTAITFLYPPPYPLYKVCGFYRFYPLYKVCGFYRFYPLYQVYSFYSFYTLYKVCSFYSFYTLYPHIRCLCKSREALPPRQILPISSPESPVHFSIILLGSPFSFIKAAISCLFSSSKHCPTKKVCASNTRSAD